MNGRQGTIAGQPVVVPNVGEGQYGQAYADLFAAYYQGLVFSGGSNPVTAIKSSSPNPASSGVVRLARSDELHFGAADWALGVDANNRLSWRGAQQTYQPTVVATATGGQVSNNVEITVIWNTATVNSGTMLNTGTGVVTIPQAGLYWIHTVLLEGQASASATNNAFTIIRVNSVNQRVAKVNDSTAGRIAFPQVQAFGLYRLNANDTVDIRWRCTDAGPVITGTAAQNGLFIRRLCA